MKGLACLNTAQTGYWYSFNLSQPANTWWKIMKFWITFSKAWRCTKDAAIEVIL